MYRDVQEQTLLLRLSWHYSNYNFKMFMVTSKETTKTVNKTIQKRKYTIKIQLNTTEMKEYRN